jgi:asparagine synthase (glutamine-hydrolysing)
MPGFAGFIAKQRAADLDRRLSRMLAPLQHEAHYLSGHRAFPELGLWVAWSMHAESGVASQPYWNESRDIGLIFRGDLPLDPQVLQELKSRGHAGISPDPSALVHWYEEKGESFVHDIPGWFSGLVIDQRAGSAVLFNDRYGLSRIYLHENADGIYFASEAKALLAVLPEVRRLDTRGLAEVVSCGCVLENRSLFQGISLLPGASLWFLSKSGETRRTTYFSPSVWEEQGAGTAETYYQGLKSSFEQVLPRCLSGSQRVGVSLTGGLDSRMFMAGAHLAPQAVDCYTFAGAYRECADVRLAREVARLCQQPYQLIPVAEDFLSQFPQLAPRTVYLTDGTMDVTGAVELYVNRAARQIAPVRVTGNYGSEVIRHNVAFRPSREAGEHFDAEFVRQIGEAGQTYRALAGGHPLSFILFKQVPWHHYSRLAVEESQLVMRTPFLEKELVSSVYRAPEELRRSLGPSLRLIQDASPSLTSIDTDRGVSWHPTPVLTKLRNGYQEFTVRAEYAYDYGMPQWLAKVDRVLQPLHLEKLFLGRHKFYHFRVWYRDRLGNYLKEVLLDRRTLSRGLWDGKVVERMVNDHVSGRANRTSEIHRLLSTELTFRQLIENSWNP